MLNESPFKNFTTVLSIQGLRYKSLGNKFLKMYHIYPSPLPPPKKNKINSPCEKKLDFFIILTSDIIDTCKRN